MINDIKNKIQKLQTIYKWIQEYEESICFNSNNRNK